MPEIDNLYSLLFENIKKLLCPEEWITLDLEFSKSEIIALLLVDKHGEIIMSQVADYINVPMSTATGVVDRLVRKGYLKRDRNESDRRIVVIRLTEKGAATVQKLKDTASEYINSLFSTLTLEEREFLYRIALKVVDVINAKPLDVKNSNESKSTVRKIEID